LDVDFQTNHDVVGMLHGFARAARYLVRLTIPAPARRVNRAMSSERVLVVPTELFHALGHFQGFCHEANRYLAELLKPGHTRFLPRAEVEEDPSQKQLIPYVIFRHTDTAGTVRLFQYTRGTGQGEGRLHRKRSVGVGGHISAADVGAHAADPYAEGLRRELEEEVILDTPYRQRCVGLINDDRTPVGRVHLGVVHLFDVERAAVRPREADLLESGFQPVERLLADLSGFETWSQICLQALFPRGLLRGRNAARLNLHGPSGHQLAAGRRAKAWAGLRHHVARRQ
jgi:predicted NUDIX family phosphoesterase